MNRREYLFALGAVAGVGPSWCRSSLANDQPSPTPDAPMVLGPDPNTRTPAFRLPAGAIDTHTHIFGPIATYPYAKDRPYTPPEAPLERLRKLHAKLGVDRGVIVNATVYGDDNQIVIDALTQSNAAYRGVCSIDDRISDARLEALNNAGFVGCRFTFGYRRDEPDTTVFDRVVDKIKGLGWHVDLLLGNKALDELSPKLRTVPIRFVLGTLGGVANPAEGVNGPSFKALVDLLRSDEKCWVKIMGPERISASGVPYQDVVPFARKLIETAPDRVLWGTDWPHPNVKIMPNDADLVDFIPQYAPDAALQHKLLIENPARLYKFDS